MAEITIEGFSTGVISKELASSMEVPEIRSALSLCSNTIITQLGMAESRPGTEYIADCFNPGVSRLVEFEFNVEQKYMLEFNNVRMRVLKDKALVETSPGVPFELGTTYSLSDIQEMDYDQSTDTLYIVHGDHTPRKLTRTADDVWTLDNIDNIDGPYLDRQPGDEDITVRATLVTGEVYDLYATDTIFSDVTVGDAFTMGFPIPADTSAIYWAWMQITDITDDQNVEAQLRILHPEPLNYNQVKNALFRSGTQEWDDISDVGSSLTYDSVSQSAILYDGAGAGLGKMEQSITSVAKTRHTLKITADVWDGGTSSTIRVSVGATSEAADILAWQTITVDGTYYYNFLTTAETVFINVDTTGSATGDYTFISEIAMFTVDNDTGARTHNTTDWRKGAWSSIHGFPQKVTIDGQRLIFARNESQPDTIWVSRLGAFENFSFTTPTVATDAFSFNPATTTINGILSMFQHNGLKVITAGALWNVFASDGGEITPLDVNINVASSTEFLDLAPITIGNSIIATPRGSEEVLELTSSFEASGYVPSDLSARAPHLFKDRRIIRWAYARSPGSIIWCVLDNGDLLGLTYNKNKGMWAWHHHRTPLGVGFADVKVIANSSDDNIDDVYFVVNRAVEGVAADCYLECLSNRITSQTAAYGLSASGTPTDYRCLDSALTYDSSTVITGVTKANPAVVSSTAHGYSNGDYIRIQNVIGMTELNNGIFKVANKNANDYQLTDESDVDIDSTAYATYLSGGEAREMITVVSGLDHLEGQTVSALADGKVEKALLVTSGSITVSLRASFIHVGLPFVPQIDTIELEAFTKTGTTQGQKKTIKSAAIYFADSRNAKITTENLKDVWKEIKFYDEANGQAPTPLFDGVKIKSLPSNTGYTDKIKIKQDDPLPLTITRIVVNVDPGRQQR